AVEPGCRVLGISFLGYLVSLSSLRTAPNDLKPWPFPTAKEPTSLSRGELGTESCPFSGEISSDSAPLPGPVLPAVIPGSLPPSEPRHSNQDCDGGWFEAKGTL
ncbi:unnamed protein product, partial [Pylaiella littoralis]